MTDETTVPIDQDTWHSVRHLLAYLFADEQDDYFAAGCPENHIYRQVRRVAAWVEAHREAFRRDTEHGTPARDYALPHCLRCGVPLELFCDACKRDGHPSV